MRSSWSGHCRPVSHDRGTGPERRWKPKLFHNFPGPDSDGGALAYRVAVATAAAPTYFASYDGYIDGGVFATNPSMCALAQTQDARIPADERAELHELRREARVLLSDVTAATEWPIARSVVEELELPMPEDEDDQLPAGDLGIVADLGLPAMDMGALLDDYDLYPDEILGDIAHRLGFGSLYDETLGVAAP